MILALKFFYTSNYSLDKPRIFSTNFACGLCTWGVYVSCARGLCTWAKHEGFERGLCLWAV